MIGDGVRAAALVPVPEILSVVDPRIVLVIVEEPVLVLETEVEPVLVRELVLVCVPRPVDECDLEIGAVLETLIL